MALFHFYENIRFFISQSLITYFSNIIGKVISIKGLEVPMSKSTDDRVRYLRCVNWENKSKVLL